MPSIDSDLTALLGSRICHDLISPIGAIGNGVELLELSGFDSPEMGLIREAVQAANQRIRFFRLAFGAAPDRQMITPAEIANVLPGGVFGPKLPLIWQADGDLPRADVKLACLALMCLETALPFGGQLYVTRSEDRWHITGMSDRIKEVPDLWAMLSGDGPMALPAPAQLHFALLGQALTAHARNVELDVGENQVSLGF